MLTINVPINVAVTPQINTQLGINVAALTENTIQSVTQDALNFGDLDLSN